ncbi:MAG: M81 family metallopeptidase [Pseudomonadota bacterium]
MVRIALGGWQHETNTFAPLRAHYTDFLAADEWPGLSAGSAMVTAVEDVHIPIAGALAAVRAAGHTVLPLLWASATPSSYVTDEAFERIATDLLARLEAVLPVDGVYLDLHGAMVSESHEDGEGEILRRVRALVGAAVPIAVSLDMHANLTDAMVAHSDVIDLFRTYPHTDMGETGARTARHLMAMLDGTRWHKAYRKPGFLIPLNAGCTSVAGAAQAVYDTLPAVLDESVQVAGVAVGFHLSDFGDVGPGVVAYGPDVERVEAAADTLLAAIEGRRTRFDGAVMPLEDAVASALAISATAARPVVLADTQDNPGGGGTGDTVGLLSALLEAGADRGVVGSIYDPAVAEQAHAAGQGARLCVALGGKRMPGQAPLECEAEVLRLGGGEVVGTGPMYLGARIQLGTAALLGIGGLKVVVSSVNVALIDQALFRHFGVEPAEQALVAVKSSVHFRNDFEQIAERVIVVAAPGAVVADPGALQYTRARVAWDGASWQVG